MVDKKVASVFEFKSTATCTQEGTISITANFKLPKYFGGRYCCVPMILDNLGLQEYNYCRYIVMLGRISG
jgi:hypothetical protein